MNVLVAYATRHGATAGIAERIAAGLRDAEQAAAAHPVKDVGDLAAYDAFVVGSAAYMFRWLKEATKFAKRHRAILARHPVWLFSSGPVGTDLVDDKGRDIFEASRPKESTSCSRSSNPGARRSFSDPTTPTLHRWDSPSVSSVSCRPPKPRCRSVISATGRPSTPGRQRSPPSFGRSKLPDEPLCVVRRRDR